MSTINDATGIEVDFGSDDRPKYIVLESAIRTAISRGNLAQGQQLPAVRDLAWRVGVTPGTVARAYARLTDDGTLEAAVGRGTFVAAQRGPAPIYRDFAVPEVDMPPDRVLGEGATVNMMSPHLPSVGQADLIRRLLSEVAGNPPSGMMSYPSFASERPAREAARGFLDHPTLGPLEADDITLTNGGQHGISLVMQAVLTGRRPIVLVEDLTYPGFRRVADMMRADTVSVATDADGIIPEALEAAARHADAQLLCTSPDVHNPTCAVTPTRRREEIAEIARAANLQILEDDCYQMMRSGLPTYRLLAPDLAWHVSSIAKTITPALRLGFAISPRAHRLTLRRAAEYSSFGLATPMGDLTARLLAHPTLPGLMAETRAQVTAYVHGAAKVMGGVDLRRRENVPFLWLVLPEGWRASTFCRAAESVGVKIRAAEEYAAREARAPHAVRLAVNAGVSLETYVAATARLRDLLDHPPEGLGV